MQGRESPPELERETFFAIFDKLSAKNQGAKFQFLRAARTQLSHSLCQVFFVVIKVECLQIFFLSSFALKSF